MARLIGFSIVLRSKTFSFSDKGPNTELLVWFSLNLAAAQLVVLNAAPCLQERSLDSLDLLGSLQHQLRHRLPSPPALLQQPDTAPRRPSVRGPEPRGEVERRSLLGLTGV